MEQAGPWHNTLLLWVWQVSCAIASVNILIIDSLQSGFFQRCNEETVGDEHDSFLVVLV